jgi:hypothetical protein
MDSEISKKAFEIINEFAKVLFSDKNKVDINKIIKFKIVNGVLKINGKDSYYKQIKNKNENRTVSN